MSQKVFVDRTEDNKMGRLVDVATQQLVSRSLPMDSEVRKRIPITTGFMDYFPLAIAYAAMISYLGNKKHNPGQPLHWSRGKSADHPDCIGRHLIDRHFDDGGILEAGQAFWRAGANLQIELEKQLANGIDIWAPIREDTTAK